MQLIGPRIEYHSHRPPRVVQDPDWLGERCEVMYRAAELIERYPYRFAKTLANIPHSYTVKHKWESADDYNFVARAARVYGEKTWYRTPGHERGYHYYQLAVNGYTYWTIDYILNRRRMFYMSVYDEVASQYDEAYASDDPQFSDENRRVKEIVGAVSPGESVLDIGSGTGLFLELSPEVQPEQYTAIEPSTLMAMEFAARHPAFRHRVLHCSIDDYWPWDARFDLVLALFGAGEAVTDVFKLRRLIAPGGRAVIMRYGREAPEFWGRFDVAELRSEMYPELRDELGRGVGIGEHVLHVVGAELKGADIEPW